MIALDFYMVQGQRILHPVAAYEVASEALTLTPGQRAAGIRLLASDGEAEWECTGINAGRPVLRPIKAEVDWPVEPVKQVHLPASHPVYDFKV